MAFKAMRKFFGGRESRAGTTKDAPEDIDVEYVSGEIGKAADDERGALQKYEKERAQEVRSTTKAFHDVGIKMGDRVAGTCANGDYVEGVVADFGVTDGAVPIAYIFEDATRKVSVTRISPAFIKDGRFNKI